MESILAEQSRFFDFPVTVADVDLFRCNGGQDYTVVVHPKGVGRNASLLACKIFHNNLTSTVDRVTQYEAWDIARKKGMGTVPLLYP